jgi:hypothetical protein
MYLSIEFNVSNFSAKVIEPNSRNFKLKVLKRKFAYDLAKYSSSIIYRMKISSEAKD